MSPFGATILLHTHHKWQLFKFNCDATLKSLRVLSEEPGSSKAPLWIRKISATAQMRGGPALTSTVAVTAPPVRPTDARKVIADAVLRRVITALLEHRRLLDRRRDRGFGLIQRHHRLQKGEIAFVDAVDVGIGERLGRVKFGAGGVGPVNALRGHGVNGRDVGRGHHAGRGRARIAAGRDLRLLGGREQIEMGVEVRDAVNPFGHMAVGFKVERDVIEDRLAALRGQRQRQTAGGVGHRVAAGRQTLQRRRRELDADRRRIAALLSSVT